MLYIEVKDPYLGWTYYCLAFRSCFVSVADALSRFVHRPVRVINIVDNFILYEIAPPDLIDTTDKLRWQEVGF